MSNTQRAAVPEIQHADNELLTLEEVAVVVRVPVATMRYWRHLGTGPRSSIAFCARAAMTAPRRYPTYSVVCMTSG